MLLSTPFFLLLLPGIFLQKVEGNRSIRVFKSSRHALSDSTAPTSFCFSDRVQESEKLL